MALIEPGSCFAGTLAELAFAADRAVMCGAQRRRGRLVALSALNFGAYPMSNGLTRLETRFLGEPESVGAGRGRRSGDGWMGRGRRGAGSGDLGV